jgi:hypothetical protein
MSDDRLSFLKESGVETIRSRGIVHKKAADNIVNLLSSEGETKLIQVAARRNNSLKIKLHRNTN